MSAFNPLAALAQSAVAAAEQSIAQEILTLGDAAQVLQAKITVGDQIPATILAPANGQDLLSFLGQTVVAQLPPGLNPGETLLLQVTGFQGSQIVVRNLGTVDPANLPPPINIALPAAAPDAPQRAVLSSSIAPPVEVFVAAAVRTPPAPIESTAQPTVSARVQAPTPESLPPAGIVEARIAATRAAGPESMLVPNRATGRSAASPRSAPPLVASRIASPVTSRVASPVTSRVAIPATRAVAAQSADEVLLTRLRVPILPITLAAAKTMGDAARAIPRIFAELDHALAQLVSNDPRVAPLRALLAFTGRIDPSNLRALPEQIASFVGNVLDGAEAKLAAIITLLQRGAAAELAPANPAETSSAASSTNEFVSTGPQLSSANAPTLNAPTSNVAPPPLPGASPAAPLPTSLQANIQAQVAVRSAALGGDVKSVILSMLQSPPEGSAPALTQALTQALTAVTGLQLNTLNAQMLNPQAISIALPVFYREGGAASQVRVTRDGANGQRLDRDNFHVAFILDTQSLGTVAIDLQAVGRAITVDVKTEGVPAANRFAATLADLRGRLEGLRYRVASLAAAVAAPRAVSELAPTDPSVSADAAREVNPPAQLDVRA